MKYLLALLLLPFIAFGQESKPVESIKTAAYKKLIRNDTATAATITERPDTFSLSVFSGTDKPIRKVRLNNQSLSIYAKYPQQLRISGNYGASLDWRTPGRQPALQSAFTQGRSSASGLIWQGPESNELFSYGPAFTSLEYDGKPSVYDNNGSLVAAGHGNGKPASPYSNSIFRTAVAFTQHFNLQARIMNYHKMVHELKLGITNSNEQTYIRYNNNAYTTFNVSYATVYKWLNLIAKYNRTAESYSNSNTNGFLNRAYQETLLTPPSFDIGQGYTLTEGQRSYSNKANNPFYLLKDNDNYFNNLRQQASLLLKRNAYRKVKYTLMQIVEFNNNKTQEAYKPYSAWFPDGRYLNRSRSDQLYEVEGTVEKDLRISDAFTSNALLSYGLSDSRNTLQIFPFNNYRYQRTTQESKLFYKLKYKEGNASYVNAAIGNNLYVSNTANRNFFFLPQATIEGVYSFRYSPWSLGGSLSFAEAAFENPITQSYGYSNFTRVSILQAPAYFPVQDVSSFDGINAARHRDVAFSLNVFNSKIVNLSASFYSKKVIDEIAPVADEQTIRLANIGDYSTKGLDITLSRSLPYVYNAKWSFSQEITFSTYKTKVTRAGAYNFLALKGFNDLHTAWVEGLPVNAIVGSAWIRDADNRLLIGDDGYPAPQKTLQVIGDPNPDFILKYYNNITFGNWTLSAMLEWKKGGEKWNGTQALLDYYGVSAISGEQRGIKNYIFEGVHTDGTKNATPVDFYDPQAAVYDNRWVRYGPGGVGEAYIQKADWLRLSNITLGYVFRFSRIIRQLETRAYVSNLLLWTPYKGADPAQGLFDLPGAQGLDYFNLPGLKTYGFNVSIQF